MTTIKSEKTQMTNIKNETSDITTNSVTTGKIIREYDSIRFCNLDEMDQFIKKHKLHLSQYADNLNSCITLNEI